MKQLFLFLAVIALMLFSCSRNKKQVEATNEAQAFGLNDLLTVADQKVDQTITLVGYVTHTCKHSGKKCFIAGDSQETTIRVEAKGEIEAFTPELIGSKLSITGVLKEEQLSSEYINEIETEYKKLQNQEGMAEICATELSNISEMRQWMKDRNKDYYIIYYIDGMKYEVLN
jgi:hypothetical protein